MRKPSELNCWHHRHFDSTDGEYAHNKLLTHLNTYNIDPEKCKIIKSGVGVNVEYDLYYVK
jgi:hypothetical protein